MHRRFRANMKRWHTRFPHAFIITSSLFVLTLLALQVFSKGSQVHADLPYLGAFQNSGQVACVNIETGAPEAVQMTVVDHFEETSGGGLPIFTCIGGQDLRIVKNPPADTAHTLTGSCPTSPAIFEQAVSTNSGVYFVSARCQSAGETLTLSVQDPPGVPSTQHEDTYTFNPTCPPTCPVVQPPPVDPACAQFAKDGNLGVDYEQCLDDIKQFGKPVPPKLREICNRRASPPGGDPNFDVNGCIADVKNPGDPKLFKQALDFWCTAQVSGLPTSTPDEVSARENAYNGCYNTEFAAAGFQDQAPTTGNVCPDSGEFGWITCPIVRTLGGVVDAIHGSFIDPLLTIDPLKTSCEPGQTGCVNDAIYGAWKGLRNLANVFFVIVFFAIIFSQAVGVGLDAYSIKKTLPRLVIAVITVQLSYYIAGIMIDFSNILGQGVAALIHAPFAALPGDPPSIVGELFGGGVSILAAGVGIAAGLLTLTPLLGAAALIVITVIATLAFRILIIYVLIIVSPLAFVASVLPNTQSLFKNWWNLLFRALMMYPIIEALFEASKVLSKLIDKL